MMEKRIGLLVRLYIVYDKRMHLWNKQAGQGHLVQHANNPCYLQAGGSSLVDTGS